MTERNSNGYYRRKLEYHELYDEIISVYERFIQPDMLKQVWHTLNTHTNEAMNTSVVALDSKNKTYSISNSLRTKVAIDAGCQAIELSKFWTICCQSLGFEIDPYLVSLLETRDVIETKKNTRSSKKKGKHSRSNLKYEKYNSALKKQRDDYEQGLEFTTGISAAAVK